MALQTLTETEDTMARRTSMNCRFCGAALERTFVDLGMSPLCETYPSVAELARGEMYYPLHVYICEQCWLVQLEEFETAESIFSDYAYFASFSDSWLKHCEKYCNDMKARFDLNAQSFVAEVASNDGYLLQYFVRMGIPVLGIEPAANVAGRRGEERRSNAGALLRSGSGDGTCRPRTQCGPHRRQ